MALLAEIYDKSLTKTLQSVYYAVLQDMQDDDFKQAVKRLLQERVFATFPKPAEILSLSNVTKVVVDEVDATELKAKELIKLVEGMNHSIYLESEKGMGTFDDLLEAVSFPTVCEDTKAILSKVKPFYDLKQLIKGINTYQTSVEQIKAFKQALSQPQAIENRVVGMIERR